MAKGNEERGGLLLLAAGTMKVFAEDCSFMLRLTQWNRRLPAKDSPAASPSLVIVGQVCGRLTNQNRSSPLILLSKQTQLVASSLLYQMQVVGATLLPRCGM